eukprot:6177515-Pleurochrysis_carterae.AAC.2
MAIFRGGARPTKIMASVLRRYQAAWQALVSNYHAPAFFCRVFQMQQMAAAVTVARQMSAG